MAVSTIDALYHSGSEKLTTSATGITVTGNATFADNGKAIFGAGSDLQIYHDGTNSYIDETATGHLFIRSNGDGIYLRSSTNEEIAHFNVNGSVKAYYDNSLKFETTSTGIDVTGTVTSDGLTVATSASGFASQITNNNDSSQGLQVRTSDNDGDQFILDLQSSSSSTGTDYASKFLVTKNGNVGIGGTPDSGRKLHIEGGDATVGITLKDTAGGQFGINSDGGSLIFKSDTANSTRMQINVHGRTSGGATTDYRGSSNETTGSWSLGENGNLVGAAYQDIPIIANRMGNDGYAVSIRRRGTQIGGINISGTTTQYITSSDYRLKENVVDLTGASARVNQLDVKRFNFIADDTNTLVDGFLAHEVATVVPEAINGTKDAIDADGNPDYQGIDQSKLVPLLTAALQEALTEIASLKTRVEALEA